MLPNTLFEENQRMARHEAFDALAKSMRELGFHVAQVRNDGFLWEHSKHPSMQWLQHSDNRVEVL